MEVDKITNLPDGKYRFVEDETLKQIFRLKEIHRTLRYEMDKFISTKGLDDEFYNEYYKEGNGLILEAAEIAENLNKK